MYARTTDVSSCAETKSSSWVALADPDASTRQLLPAAGEWSLVCPVQLIVAAMTDELAVTELKSVRTLPAPHLKVVPALVDLKSLDLKDFTDTVKPRVVS